MNLSQLTEEQRVTIRKNCLRSLFCFCTTVMGYDDITEELHGELCTFLESPKGRKQVTMPRSFVKTWISTIAYSVWISLPRIEDDEFPSGVSSNDKFYLLGSNIRILIASYVISNAEKMISLIRKTYEANVAMQILFPEVIPDNFKKVRWSNSSACINRSENFTESTFEAAGIGGSSTSRHYDLILEDDLIYANKDDFSGQELQPNQEDIDKAIGWHKIATSLLVPGKHTRIHNTGTRWAKHDLVDYIWKHEPDYIIFRRACVELPDTVLGGEQVDSNFNWEMLIPTWNQAYDIEQLRKIAAAQGPYMFATQYLLIPSSPEELLFKTMWLQYYSHVSEIPEYTRIWTTVDVSEWGEDERKKHCKCALLTCAWDTKGHMWILGYTYKRLNPTEVILEMDRHHKLYKPEIIYVEAVYYQKALAHFTREYMDEKKIDRFNVRELLPEGGKSKDIRIMALEPLASTLAIHLRKDMVDFISEYSEYSSSNRLCKKDLLDAAAYQLQIHRKAVAPVQPRLRPRLEEALTEEAIEMKNNAILREHWDADSYKDEFGNEGVPKDPFDEEERYSLEDWMVGIHDPYTNL